MRGNQLKIEILSYELNYKLAPYTNYTDTSYRNRDAVAVERVVIKIKLYQTVLLIEESR